VTRSATTAAPIIHRATQDFVKTADISSTVPRCGFLLLLFIGVNLSFYSVRAHALPKNTEAASISPAASVLAPAAAMAAKITACV